MEIQLSLSYGQLCVFDPALEAPLNDWTDAHVNQGFSWRNGSVSFATADEQASAAVTVTCSDAAPDLGGAETAIRVPFEVPTSGTVEIGGVFTGVEASLPPGHYALFFLSPRNEAEPFQLVFVPAAETEPAVLREGPRAKVQDRYLMTADPA